MSDFCYTQKIICGSAWLSQIPRSSLSPSLQSSPVSGLVIKTLIFVPESNLCETPIEEAKSQKARMARNFAPVSINLSPPAASDFGMLFLDHENRLSAIIGITFVNILKALHFLGCFCNLGALWTNPIYSILHIVCILRRGTKTYTSEKPYLSLASSLHWQFQ